MGTVITHIQQRFSKFIESENEGFQVAFSKMSNSRKEEYKTILKYIDKVLYGVIGSDKNSVKKIHLHLHCIDNLLITLLGQYIIIREHYFNQSKDVRLNEINPDLHSKIGLLNKEKRRLEQCPSKASAKNGGNRIYNKWKEEKAINKSKLSLFKSHNPKSSFTSKSLFNCQIKTANSLSYFIEKSPYTSSIDNSKIYYNITNTDITLEDIDRKNSKLIDQFQTVILYNCERKTIMQNYNFQEIENWNKEFGTNILKYIIITFSKNNVSSNNLFNRLKLVKERFRIDDCDSYTILYEEYNSLKVNHRNKNVNISFIGSDCSVFWEDFFFETKINDLYELRSIKMMNVYSLCLNQVIKEYILAHIFSPNLNDRLITEDTRQDILSLPNEDILNIKDSLSNVLDVIINANLKTSITNYLSDVSKIVLDDFILKNERFLDLVKKSINIRSNRKFINWDNLEQNTTNGIIILSYRDQGNFNNHFYPNINEIIVSENTNIKCLLPALLFKEHHEWSKYNLAKDYYETLDHPLRRNYFNWDELKGKIRNLKPEKTIDISWDLESDYSGSVTRITYRIVFDNNRHSTCNPSDLHIYYEDDNKQRRIQPIRWIYENLEIEEDRLFVKKLDELIEEFNPAERLVDTERQENDLEIIRKQFDLGEESAGRLWKILLARKAADSSAEHLYNDLKTTFSRINLNIVSQGHFESTWINPDSASLVPRGNKAFKVLCNYLGLPTTYLRIIYTIKNRNINGRRNATRIYSKLLKDLFNDGCFDDEANPDQILIAKIDYYKNNHNLDELGINEEIPITDLITLIELIKPELSFKEVRSIKKREE